MLFGGWKYASSQIFVRTSWSCSRGAIVHLPQSQDQARELDFDVCHSPQLPRPLHVTNGEEMFTCVSTGHDADRVADGEILVQILAFAELTGITDNVSVKPVLHDEINIHAR